MERTLTISRKSLYLRILVWVWNAKPESFNNICKLFWGTVFIPFGWINAKGISATLVRVPLYLLLVLTMPEIIKGNYIEVITYFVVSLISFVIGIYLIKRKEKETANLPRPRQTIASVASVRRGMGWAILYFLGKLGSKIGKYSGIGVLICFAILFSPIMAFIWGISKIKKVKGIKSFFGVIVEYIHAVKEKTCPIVRIVP